MLFTPLLPEAASGTLEPRHVVVPLRVMCPHSELLLGRATELDFDRRHVCRSRRWRASSTVRYRELVVALGSISRALPIPGLADHALGFKNLADAIYLRNHVLQRLDAADAAATDDTPRTRADLRLRRRRLRGRRGARRALRPRPRRAALLPEAPARAAALGARRRGAEDPAGDPDSPRRVRGRQLTKRGVEIRVSTTLESVEAHAAQLSNGERFPTHTVVWTAGVKANPMLAQLGLPLDERGRVKVDETAARRGPRARLGARRLRCGAEPRHAGRGRPAHLAARAPPGAPPRQEPRGRAEAVPLPDARPGGHARPLQGHRRRARLPLHRLPRLVHHADVPPLPAAALLDGSCAS